MARPWRPAEAIERLKKEFNELSPNRNKQSDGTVGDESHRSTSSDHNPWIHDGKYDVVSAVDITHDPAHGIDSGKFARLIAATDDPRVKYLISNSQIWTPSISRSWRPYKGANPHNKHFHLSLHSQKALYDNTADWKAIGGVFIPPEVINTPPTVEWPLLYQGVQGQTLRVKWAQTILRSRLLYTGAIDGDFGPKTFAAVKAFQKAYGLVQDGKIGVYTRDKLDDFGAPFQLAA